MVIYDLKDWESCENLHRIHPYRNLQFGEQITSLAWVPHSEQELVFATGTGKVALVNNINQRGALQIIRDMKQPSASPKYSTFIEFHSSSPKWLLLYSLQTSSIHIHVLPEISKRIELVTRSERDLKVTHACWL